LLSDRGILRAAEQAGWRPDGDGWLYPLYDQHGKPFRLPNGAPVRRWKNFNSQASPKYLWKPGNLGEQRPKYYLLPGVRQAISNASGLVYLGSGEPDVLAFRAAGIENVLCWFGEENVPATLASDLAALGVREAVYYPDLDQTGRSSAQKVAQALAGSGIGFEAYILPQELGDKGDINRLWQHCKFDASEVRTTLAGLPALPLESVKLEPHSTLRAKPDLADRLMTYARQAYEDELSTLSGVSTSRNIQLNKSAFALGQLIGAQALNRDEVERALLAAAAGIGLGEREARATIRSGLEAGMRQPRDLSTLSQPEASYSSSSTPRSAPVLTAARGESYGLMERVKMSTMPETQWLIPDLIPVSSTVTLYGQSGTGKSFIALDFALQVSLKTSVIYVAGEGINGMLKRMDAWCKQNQKQEGNIHFVAKAPPLMNKGEVEEFLKSILPVEPKFIVFDTLARAMVGLDENSAKDMGLAMEVLAHIQRVTGATILLVHHTGKYGGSERGSSALRAACDVMLEVTNDEGYITLVCSKVKDSDEFDTLNYQLTKLDLGPERSSCVVVPTQKRLTQTSRDPLSRNQRKLLEALGLEVFIEAGAKAATLIQIAEVSAGSVYRVLSALKRMGYIRQADVGDPYFITEAGLKALGKAEQPESTPALSPLSSPSVNYQSESDSTRSNPTINYHHHHTPLRGDDGDSDSGSDIFGDEQKNPGAPKQESLNLAGSDAAFQDQPPSHACYSCGSYEWYQRADGGWLCGVCHPRVVRSG
jgi:archaellum biogenesis ATPase FlaH